MSENLTIPNQDLAVRNILGAHFRANPDFELIPFERLSREQQEQWRELSRDPSLFGLLMPGAGSPWRAKSACKDTALLFYALQSPGPLPSFAMSPDREPANRAVAQLVLDGILQIESNGSFVGGPEAASRIFPQSVEAPVDHPVARLSAEAVQYGASITSLDAGRLSARLYFFNRHPLTARWRAAFATPQHVLDFLGAGENALLRRQWVELPKDINNDGWISWKSRARLAMPASGQTYKLYLSPRPENLRDAFSPFLDSISAAGAMNFKIGRDAGGLLRPDKIVAYFRSKDDLDEATRRLTGALTGCPAQGVPFTAPAGDSAIVSWGTDPPQEDTGARESWRLWVANRLAIHLKAASAQPGVDAARFALDRMRLEGVDTATWIPASGIWQEHKG